MPPAGTTGAAAAASLTAIARPAIVTVALRAAPVLAAAVTVTAPLPEPPAALSPTQLAAASGAVLQLQPVGAVTATDCVPPVAANDSDVVETA